MKKQTENQWQTLSDIERAGGPSKRFLQNALNDKRKPLRSRKVGKHRLVRKADVLAWVKAHPSSRPPMMSADFTNTGSEAKPEPLPMDARAVLATVQPSEPLEARIKIAVAGELRKQQTESFEQQRMVKPEDAVQMMRSIGHAWIRAFNISVQQQALSIIEKVQKQTGVDLTKTYCGIGPVIAQALAETTRDMVIPALENEVEHQCGMAAMGESQPTMPTQSDEPKTDEGTVTNG